MERFRFDIRDSFAVLLDDQGRQCANVLEAMRLAKSALEAMAARGEIEGEPWIEIADEEGKLVATVRLDEARH